MLTDYSKVEGSTFFLDMIDVEGRRSGETAMIPLARVKPFIDMVQQRGLGDHGSILVGYLMRNEESDHLFVIGKTMQMIDGMFVAEHFNHHEKRDQITKTHETRVCYVERPNDAFYNIDAFYKNVFKVIDKDILSTVNALRRLYATRKIWQAYDCPSCGVDFDLFDDEMVYEGQKFRCPCDLELVATEELIETFDFNGDLSSFPPIPKTKFALEAFKKNT